MKIKTPLILLIIILNQPALLFAAMNGFGMLMDAEGFVLTQNRGLPVAIEIGDIIPFGTKITLASNSNAIIATFSKCQEWELSGEGEYLTSKKGFINHSGNSPTLTRQLPVCFNPAEFADVGHTIGGLSTRRIVKSQRHLLPLWREAATGKAKNSTLMAIVLDGIQNKTIERVRPYFEILQQRMPDSTFILKLSHYFL